MIHSSYLPNQLNIRVVPNATVELLIDVVVKKLNEIIAQHRPGDPPLNAAKCQALLAEDDGRPDTDTPPLQRDAPVHKFGCAYFALIKDPEVGGMVVEVKTFKVVLPTKEYQVMSYNRSLSLGQVLEKVCNKRQLDPLVYYLVVGPKEIEVSLDTLISDVDATELIMKSKAAATSYPRKLTSGIKHTLTLRQSRTKSRGDMSSLFPDAGQDPQSPPVLNLKASRQLGVAPTYIWSPAAVSTYVQYSVIKINKYGQRQERIMGIDRERITNSLPLNKQFKGNKQSKTNQPLRHVSDVVRAYMVDRPAQSNPNARKLFCIEFKDHVTQEFESEKAEEIVARINYINSLEKAKGYDSDLYK